MTHNGSTVRSSVLEIVAPVGGQGPRFFDPRPRSRSHRSAAAYTPRAATLSAPLLEATAVMTVTRARYTEDRLTAGAFDQYVLLGAGLDSFAWRRPDARCRRPTARVCPMV